MGIFILSFIPIFNIGLCVACPIVMYKDKNFIKKEELQKVNKIQECTECNMYIRKGYIVNECCPVCENTSLFINHADSSDMENILSDNIPYQKKFNTMNEYNNYLDDNHLLIKNKTINEQELIFEKIQLQKLKKH